MKRTRDTVIDVKDDGAVVVDVAVAAVVAGSFPTSSFPTSSFYTQEDAKDNAASPVLPPLSSILAARTRRTRPKRALPDKNTRHFYLQAAKERSTADGFVARMPALATAPLDELVAYAKSLCDFLRVPGNGHVLMPTTDRLSHLIDFLEQVRLPMLDYVTRNMAVKRAHVALLTAQCDFVKLNNDVQRHAHEPGHITDSDVQTRTVLTTQLLNDTMLAWFRALAAAPHTLTATFHQQLIAVLSQVRNLLLEEVPESIREILFSDPEV